MKKCIIRLVAVLVVIALLLGLERLVTPKYMDDILEGAFIEEYYRESGGHDVLMVGDCEVYENIDPIELWRKYGITSYIRGSAQQLIWQSYYLLEEMLKKEKPKVVVFNVLSMKYNTPQQETYNRMNLDGMRWSTSKYKAVRASMTEEEELLDYLFPLLRFHSRITELTDSDFTYFWEKRKVTHNGYYMRIDVMPAGEFEWTEERPESLEFGENAWSYLEDMRTLCEENGAELVLMKAPSLSPVWYDEYEAQIKAYADEHNLTCINYLDLVEELGIDYTTDTYDAGLHMNYSGALKCTDYLGALLVERFGLADRRTDAGIAKIWEDKTAFHDNMIADQQAELSEYGYLKSFGGEGGEDEEENEEEDEDGSEPEEE